MRKKCVGSKIKHEKMQETMTPNCFLASLFTVPSTLTTIHNITTDLDDLLTTTPHRISFSDPHWATPNLCLRLLILISRRVSDGQIYQQTFFFRLRKKTECSYAFLLEHCSGPNCPFSEVCEPSIFLVKNGNVAHQCDGHTTKHHCTRKLGITALVTLSENIFVTSAGFLPNTCSLPNTDKKSKTSAEVICSSSPPFSQCSSSL